MTADVAKPPEAAATGAGMRQEDVVEPEQTGRSCASRMPLISPYWPICKSQTKIMICRSIPVSSDAHTVLAIPRSPRAACCCFEYAITFFRLEL
jgi:hypothetical protein